jgi:hypothetical protein
MKCRFFAKGMEDSMSFRRACPVVGRLLIIALLVVVGPACGKKKNNNAPNVIAGTPLFGTGSVSHWPVIILEFDQDMDASTVTAAGNIQLIDNGTLLAFPIQPVTYNATLRQAMISPTAFLGNMAPPTATQYDVVATSAVHNTSGTSLNGTDSGPVAEDVFTVGTAANTFQPTNPNPSAVTGAGASGTIDFTWTQAQENGVNISANYDIYMSTLGTGTVDLLGAAFLSRTDNSGFTMGTGGLAGTLTPGTTYWFIIVVRDSDGNCRVTGEISAQAKP